jgi:hypothetical protein
VQAPVVHRAGASTAAAAANAQDPPAVVQQQQEGRAELCPRPKSLHELWTEYMFGIGGRKAAKDFTPIERGRCRHKYCRRKLVWDCIKCHVHCGYTSNAAIERICQVYGYNLSTTRIINAFKHDEIRGGHPNLRLVLPPPDMNRRPLVQRALPVIVRQRNTNNNLSNIQRRNVVEV